MALRWTPAERHLLMRNMIDLAERRGFYANEHEWAAQLTELHDVSVCVIFVRFETRF